MKLTIRVLHKPRRHTFGPAERRLINGQNDKLENFCSIMTGFTTHRAFLSHFDHSP